MNIVMIPIITLYLLSDWDKVTHHARNWLPLSPANRDTVIHLLTQCGQMLAGFFRGQLLVMIAQSVLYVVGLAIVGIDIAVLIGIVAGILTIIPYLGFFTGLIISLIAAFIEFHGSLLHIVGVLIVFFIGACTENFVFAPFYRDWETT